jgi:hypothetical protein
VPTHPVEGSPRGGDRRGVPRVEADHLVRGVQRHRSQHLRVTRGERLREVGAVRVPVQVDLAQPQHPKDGRHVTCGVGGVEEVTGVDVAAVRAAEGVVQLVAAGCRDRPVGIGRRIGAEGLQRRADHRCRPAGPSRVDQQQVAVAQQRGEQGHEVRRRPRRGTARAALHRHDGALGGTRGRKPGESHRDRSGSGVRVVQRHLPAAASGPAADRAGMKGDATDVQQRRRGERAAHSRAGSQNARRNAA